MTSCPPTCMWSLPTPEIHSSNPIMGRFIVTIRIEKVKEKETGNSPIIYRRSQNVFANGPSPASFSFIFSLFEYQYNFTENKCRNSPSSILSGDSNSRPLGHWSPPITTRPGLPPIDNSKVFSVKG